MTAIIIGIVIFLFWVLSGDSSSSRIESSSTTILKPTQTYRPTAVTPTVVTPPKSISVTPITIKSTPELSLSLIDGEFRTFQNYFIAGTQYTFGFPKSHCKDKRVWVGIGKKEVERISYAEAIQRINTKSIGYNRLKKQIDRRYDVYDDLPF